MKSKKIFAIIFLLFVTMTWVCQGFALTKRMHQALNREIANRTTDGFSLNTYLKDQLGFEKGVEEILLGFSEMVNENVEQDVKEWLGEGGYKEDEPEGLLRYPTNRARNNRHFHNPLKDWGKAGLDTILFTAQSLVVWAQNPNQDVGGKWSWKDARDYFHKGLTATAKTERDGFFAKTFRALGQQTHLVQDASVPEHVRNDIHIIRAYEDYVEKIRNDRSKQNIWFDWLGNPITYDRSILDIASTHPTARVSISRIIDTDLYTNNNPNITKTLTDLAQNILPQPIGLAEYANANFLSKDTVFTEGFNPDHRHYFPFPRVAGASRWKDEGNKRNYLKKTGEGDPVDHLAATSFIYSYRLRYFPQYSDYLPLGLDGRCYEEYASKLIPRAVGYSAGLLEYFFRGQLQVTAVPIFYNNSIIYLRAKIKNMTPNETMTDGTFTLTYSYRPSWGKADGSDDVWGQSPVVSSGTLVYDGEETVIDFLLSNPIPKENYDSAKFTLAFRGKLGNEEGAVIGKALALGEIKFSEEWDNGFTGNHNWAHTDFNLFDQNPANGSTSNVIEGDILVKENIRDVGHKTARVNESFLDYEYNNGQFRDILPILITPDTYLQFKIDAMSINEIPPAPPGYTNHWQALILHFNNGLSLQYFQEGQGLYTGSNTAYLTFPLGLVIVDNIYEMFKGAGITIPEPLYLESIDFLQQLLPLDQPSTVQHQQHMEIDSIRIIEGRQN